MSDERTTRELADWMVEGIKGTRDMVANEKDPHTRSFQLGMAYVMVSAKEPPHLGPAPSDWRERVLDYIGLAESQKDEAT